MIEGELSAHLLREREVLVGEIVSVFAGVSREGGTSWGQASVASKAHERWMEENAPKPEHLFQGRNITWRELTRGDDAADSKGEAEPEYHDCEVSWLDLVDDLEWDTEPEYGGFSFLDPIGSRYYLPAAMLRSLQDPHGHLLSSQLTVKDSVEEITFAGPGAGWRVHFLEKWSALNDRERVTVKRFVQFKAVVEQGRYEDLWRDLPEELMARVKMIRRPWARAYVSYWESVEDREL